MNTTKSMQKTSNILKPIRTTEAHEAALERIYELMQADVEPGSALGDELEVLSLLVEDYENTAFPMPKPDPLQAIKFRMEQMGLPESALLSILGSRSRKSEIFSGKRKLNLAMIRKLNKELNIPTDVLIQEY